MLNSRFDDLKRAGARKPHGVRARYVAGCRCAECKAANNRYEKRRNKLRQTGDFNGVVPATKVRKHLATLSRKGVGYKTVAAAAKVSKTTLAMVMRGERVNVSARTERKILKVTEAAKRGIKLVDAGPTHLLIDTLLKEGHTQTRIAELLGYKHRAIQLNGRSITEENARRVRKLYRELMAEEPCPVHGRAGCACGAEHEYGSSPKLVSTPWIREYSIAGGAA